MIKTYTPLFLAAQIGLSRIFEVSTTVESNGLVGIASQLARDVRDLTDSSPSSFYQVCFDVISEATVSDGVFESDLIKHSKNLGDSLYAVCCALQMEIDDLYPKNEDDTWAREELAQFQRDNFVADGQWAK